MLYIYNCEHTANSSLISWTFWNFKKYFWSIVGWIFRCEHVYLEGWVHLKIVHLRLMSTRWQNEATVIIQQTLTGKVYLWEFGNTTRRLQNPSGVQDQGRANLRRKVLAQLIGLPIMVPKTDPHIVPTSCEIGNDPVWPSSHHQHHLLSDPGRVTSTHVLGNRPANLSLTADLETSV